MSMIVDPKKPYPSLSTSMRPGVPELWSANRLVWAAAQGPITPRLADDEYARLRRAYDPGRRTIDEAWARFVDEDEALRTAIECPPGFMRRSLLNEIRYNQMERGAIDLGRGVLGAIHTLRATCYAWNGIVEARVAELRNTTTDPGLRQWLRVVWADVANLEALSQNRNADLRERLERRHETLLTELRDKAQSEQDLRDVEALLQHARPTPFVPPVAPPAAAPTPRRRGSSGKLPAPPA